MAISTYFSFSKYPVINAECKRRAVVMFGENWQQVCEVEVSERSAVDEFGENWQQFFEHKTVSTKVTVSHGPKQLSRKTDYGDNFVRLRTTEAGLCEDLEDGSPAEVYYYLHGQVLCVMRCRDGNLWDLDDGTPSVVNYSAKGEVTGGYSIVDGRLSAAGTVAMLKAALIRRVEQSIAKTDQSTIPAGWRTVESYIAEYGTKGSQ